jgi:rubrerythrin
MVISTKEKLEFLLHRSWEIEKNFELLSIWKGFLSVGPIHRKIILKLAKESQKHKLDLEKLLEKLNLEYPKIEIPSQSFDFENMLDIEILQRIIKNDEAVLDLYIEIIEKTDTKLITSLSGAKNTDFFFNIFTRLIEDEKGHINIVKKITGTITRIQ